MADVPSPGTSRAALVEWIERVLEMTGWSPSRLAKEAGVAPSTINRFLAGSGRGLNTDSIGRIEAAASTRMRQRLSDGEIAPATEPRADMAMIDEQDPRADDRTVQQWGFPEQWFRFTYNADPSQCIVMPIEDSAMAPDFRIGDRVVVDTSLRSGSPAGNYIIHDGMSWTCRYLELLPGTDPCQCRIRATNPDFISGESKINALRIRGRVIGMWRRV